MLGPADPMVLQVQLPELRRAASALGVELVVVTVRGRDYARAFDEIAQAKPASVFVAATTYFLFDRKPIIDLAIRHRLPTIWEWREQVVDGGLMAYGTSLTARLKLVAEVVDRILKGTPAGRHSHRAAHQVRADAQPCDGEGDRPRRAPGASASRRRGAPVTSEPLPTAIAAEKAPAPLSRASRQGRLFRKYLVLILSLVGGALVVSGAIGLYFSYQEQTTALGDLQHEKAIGAAARIEQYVRQIEQQLAYAALPQLDASDNELRRIEFLKLLRQAPEVTDIAQLDTRGREQVLVSRLGMDVIGSGKDRSTEPAFRNAKRGQPWIGPVYFRKETEPYMTVGVRSGGDNGPVTVAEVNLKFIWDVVSRIKIGEKGKAYVVDGNGFVVADPDIGRVLRKTYVGDLPHVKAAGVTLDADAPAMVSEDLDGTAMIVSYAPIAALDWKVFVEQPESEVRAKLNASILRTALAPPCRPRHRYACDSRRHARNDPPDPHARPRARSGSARATSTRRSKCIPATSWRRSPTASIA